MRFPPRSGGCSAVLVLRAHRGDSSQEQSIERLPVSPPPAPPVERGTLASPGIKWQILGWGLFSPGSARPSQQRAWAGRFPQPPWSRLPHPSDPVEWGGAWAEAALQAPTARGRRHEQPGLEASAHLQPRQKSIDFCDSHEAHPIKSPHPRVPSLSSCQVCLPQAQRNAVGQCGLISTADQGFWLFWRGAGAHSCHWRVPG